MSGHRTLASQRSAEPTDISAAASARASTAELLAMIGDRVRAQRARRGMTRKMLARESSVSERYLAQLERGQGNISIGLLFRIAIALQTTIAHLVRDNGTDTAEQSLINDFISHMKPDDQQRALALLHEHFSERRHRRIALIGLRGAGKTTIGRRLAAYRKLPFIQLGKKIEELAGMNIPEILDLTGRSGYRRFEEQALLEVLGSNEQCVLETGGGIVSDPHMMNMLLTTCFTVWVRASPDEHMRRVIEQGDLRPMQANPDAMEDLKQILEERRPFYEMAHARLDTSGRGVDECFEELLDVLGLRPG